MKSLVSICSKLISEYKKETILSVSFFLDRIVPAALYFLPILIIARYGDLTQISIYAIFSSLFTSFIAIPLGFTSAIRYYSSMSSGRSKDTYRSGSALLLTFIISVISVLLYFIYYYSFLNDNNATSNYLLFLFAIAILFVAPYYSISSYNEGQKEIKVNNICGLLSVPLFIISSILLSIELDIMSSCATAFLLTRIVMLLIIVKSTTRHEKKRKYIFSEVTKTFKYGVSIASLFFVQKLVSTVILSLLGRNGVEVAVFQVISVISMMLSLVSNAVFTNVFIKIVREEEGLKYSFFITMFNALIVYILVCYFLWQGFELSQYSLISDQQVSNVLHKNTALAFLYFFCEMFMTASFIVSRACGDNWRCQLLWCICMGVFFLFMHKQITVTNSICALIFSDVISILFGIFNISSFIRRNYIPSQSGAD